MLDRPAGDYPAAPIARRERSQVHVSPDENDTGSLTGAAVLAILRRRKLPIAGIDAVAPLLAFIAISQLTPRYTATGTLLYDASEYKARELQSILRVDPITDAVMATQAEVLRGMPVVEQVASRLNLHANPGVQSRAAAGITAVACTARFTCARALVRLPRGGPRGRPGSAGSAARSRRNATLLAVRTALTVTPVKASHVLEVSFTAEDPVFAAAAANDAMDVYVKAQLGAKYGAVAKARDWLEQRARELRDEVRRIEERASPQYRAQNGLVEGMHARLDSEQISLLTEDLAHARNALAEAEGRLDAASGRAGAAAQAAIAPSVVQLRARQDQLAAELQSMLGRLGPRSSGGAIRCARSSPRPTARLPRRSTAW